jgi:hypothetical protein
MISATTTCKLRPKRALWLALAVPLGCAYADRKPPTDQVFPTSVLRVETAIHRSLVENSIAITSERQPGIIFGANDSGHEPWLFAFDSSGRGRGVWNLVGATNRDWEAATRGPCADTDSTPSCIYIGDVGDNDARRQSVTIYRVAEPVALPTSGAAVPLPVLDRLSFRYADRPHDVEAMYATPDGSIFLITKRRLLNPQRRPRWTLMYRIPPSAWDSSGTVTASLVDSLPIVPGESRGRQVNDASLSADGKMLAVRTYAEVFVFRVDSATGLPEAGQAPVPCILTGLDQERAEGVAWWWDSRRLLLTSERRNAPLHIVACPLPSRGQTGVRGGSDWGLTPV